GNLGLIPGFHESLEAFHHELGRTAAQHGLLAEQIGLGLLAKGRIEYAAACSADAVSVGERLCMRFTGCILRNRNQARDTAALLILAADEVARSLGRNQNHIEILAWLDLFVVNIEAVCKQQGGAFLQALLDALV